MTILTEALKISTHFMGVEPYFMDEILTLTGSNCQYPYFERVQF
jgi:hypothetical protein